MPMSRFFPNAIRSFTSFFGFVFDLMGGISAYHSLEFGKEFAAQRPPSSHARNHDLSAHGLYRASDQVTCPNTIQAIVDLAGLFGQVAFGLENYALAVLELRHALAEASPFRCAYHSCFLGAGV
jgi:hypothetical protein